MSGPHFVENDEGPFNRWWNEKESPRRQANRPQWDDCVARSGKGSLWRLLLLHHVTARLIAATALSAWHPRTHAARLHLDRLRQLRSLRGKEQADNKRQDQWCFRKHVAAGMREDGTQPFICRVLIGRKASGPAQSREPGPRRLVERRTRDDFRADGRISD